jgi:hypothetical protein
MIIKLEPHPELFAGLHAEIAGMEFIDLQLNDLLMIDC